MVRAGLWMTLAALLFVTMGVVTKTLGARLPAVEIAFFRASLGFLLLLPLYRRAGLHLLTTPNKPLLLLRALLGSAAMLAGFYAVVHLPLAEATALGFTKPLFLVVLAGIVLGERVTRIRTAALIAGFVGVLVMLRPGSEAFAPAAFVALLGALCAAAVGVLVRRLVALEPPHVLLFWLGLVSAPLTLALALPVWVAPAGAEWAGLLLVGALGTLSQLALMRAYRLAEASALAPFDYLRLPFAALYGWWLFGEWPDAAALSGAGLIVLATLVLALGSRRETVLDRAPSHRPAELAAGERSGRSRPDGGGAVVSSPPPGGR